jgi:putative ABC transport system permease protein
MKSGGRTSTSTRTKLHHILTASEVAIALMLVVGAGLMIRSVYNLIQVGVGFNTDQLVFTDIEPPPSYSDDAKHRQFYAQMLEHVRTLPGVTSAGVGSGIPLHSMRMQSFNIVGREPVRDRELPVTESSKISPGFLETIGQRLIAGRRLTEEDVKRNESNGKADRVGLINQTFAEKFFPGDNPLDHRVKLDDHIYQIVGVVADVRVLGPEKPVQPQFFRAGEAETNMVLALRSAVPAEALAETLRKTVWTLDKEVPALELSRMDYYFLHTISDYGFQMILLVAFASVGLLLAMLGVFSVLAHSVASRTREFGVRLALGASPSGIGRLVALQSAWPLGLGVLAGLAGSFALSQFLESQLFKVNAHDPLVFGLAIVTVLLAAPLAIWLPVRRASKVECTEALREE